jgi:hypothetical protein
MEELRDLGDCVGVTGYPEVMPETDFQLRGREVLFWEIAIDVPQARFWPTAFPLEQVKLTVHTASPSLGVPVRNTSKESVRLLRATLHFRPDISA